MKKIFVILLSVVATLVFVQTVRAQRPYPTQGEWSIANQIYDRNSAGGVGDITKYPLIFPNSKGLHQPENTDFAYSKDISAPLSDGTYWIKLESFSTGVASYVESAAPADIVLVLDLSSSMVDNTIPLKPEDYHWGDYIPSHSAGPYWRYNDFEGNPEYYIEYQGTQYRVYAGSQRRNGTYYYFMYFEVGNTRYFLDETSIHPSSYYNRGYPEKVTSSSGSIYRLPLIRWFTTQTRLDALKKATCAFIDEIEKNDKFEDDGVTEREGGRLGNRISIVTFWSQANLVVSLSQGALVDEDEDDATHSTAEELKETVRNFTNGSGTRPDLGIQEANNQFEQYVDAARRLTSSRTVVVFTDGEPYPNENYENYNTAIAAALKSKTEDNPETTAVEGYDATVFTVGLFSSKPRTGSSLWTFMNLMSSNAPNASSMTVTGDDYTPEPTGKFYKDASGENADLTAVFTEIAHQSGGSTSSLSAATKNVDVVSNSFVLPEGASENIANYVKVFVAKLRTIENGAYTFYEEYLAGHTPSDYTYYPLNEEGERISDVPIKVDANIELTYTAPNVIKVTGFDYSSNFCGPVYNEEGTGIDHYQGYKIIIMIPIQMNPNAVGGPDVKTNGPGSGIFVTDSATSAFVSYESPEVSLPVNIHITKSGLSKGESAKFKIERATLPESGPVVYDNLEWKYVSTVFVTKPQNAGDEDPDPVVYVRGLPANQDVTTTVGEGEDAVTTTEHRNYVYRVSEEKWSWSYDPLTPPMYTDTDYIDNPFRFRNKIKDNIDVKIRHAESKATNIFKLGVVEGNVRYDDSKTNVRNSGNGGSGTGNEGNTGSGE